MRVKVQGDRGSVSEGDSAAPGATPPGTGPPPAARVPGAASGVKAGSPALMPEAGGELDQKLAELRDAVSNSRVPEARVMVKELETRWPESERVQHWARVLAPPVVVPTTGPDPRSRPRDRERAWLKAHGHEYPGCWLAVYEDRLIAADPDLAVVYAEVRRTLGAEGALLHYQPGEPHRK